MKEIEITLQASVLSRSAVNGDIGKVECDLPAIHLKAEVIPVNGRFAAVGQLHVPVESVHLHNI